MNQKILIIKLCCFGDIIQVMPSLKALKDSGAEVHYLCIDFVKPLLELIPSVDRIFTIKTNNIINILKTLLKLNKENYDIIINFHRDIKSFLFMFFIRAKIKAGFKWGKSNFLLSKSFLFDPDIHESKRYLSIIKGLGFDVTEQIELLRIPEKSEQQFEIFGNKKAGLFPGGGVNPGTVMYTKRWPLENFIKLAGMLIDDNFSVYVFGGLIDKSLVNEIKNKVPQVKEIITADIKDFVFYVSKMDIFIAPDTGPLHIASATGIKTLGLFGPSSPELVAPINKNSTYLKGITDCSPCYIPETVHKKEFLKCTDNICMKSITVEMVYEKIKNLME
jgi:ADP-heptose:LPS heptosyltransferase